MIHRARPSKPLAFSAIFAVLALLPIAAKPAAAQSVSLQLRNASGAVAFSFQEFEPITLRATDSGLAGAGTIEVLVESQLRGDTEWVELVEQPAASGIFSAVLPTAATLDLAPPAHSDGTLELTELAGPPLQRDTVFLTFSGCSLPSCPSAQAAISGNLIQLQDAWGYDVNLVRPPSRLYVSARDFSAAAQSTLAVTLSASGDSETLDLIPAAGAGRFGGSIVLEYGPAVPGDGQVQVALGATLTASIADPLGLSQATDSVAIAENRVLFADGAGNPGYLLMEGPIRVQYESQAANQNPSAADTFTASLISLESLQQAPYVSQRDSETLVLTETGAATGIFSGELPHQLVSGPGSAGDGALQAGPQDSIQVFAGSVSLADHLISGIVRFTDANGSDVLEVHAGNVYLELLSYLDNVDENAADQALVTVETGAYDSESVVLTEQGADSSLFRGSISAVMRSPTAGNAILEGLLGETVEAVHVSFGPSVPGSVQWVEVPDNLPPVALGDSIATQEDQSALVDPLANDSDPDDDPLSVLDFTQGAHGSVAREAGDPQKLRYTPAANYSGNDSFTYTVQDSSGGTATATIAVSVSPVDDPPVAANDTAAGNEDAYIYVKARFNDTDPDGDAFTVVRFDAVSAHGTITAYSTAFEDFRYRANAHWHGTDTFTYEIEANGVRATGTVTVVVYPVPDSPLAVADNVTTLEETPVTIALLANDSDPDGQSFTLYAVQTNGNNVVTHPDGTVTFTPAANFFGLKTFTYQIRDSGGSFSSAATVRVTVTNVNDPPLAQNDTLSAAEDVLATFNVRANDSDPDNDVLSIQSVTQPTHGTVTFVSTSVQYRSHLNYNGPDSFTYTVADPSGATSTATVNLTVTPVNDPPLGLADVATTPEDTAVLVDVLANDSDPEAEALTIASWSYSTGAMVTRVLVDGRHHLLYTPKLDYHGPASFSYTVRDASSALSALTVVSVTVTPVNDPPKAVNDAATTAEDTAVTINVLANDSDLEGSPLSVAGASLGGGATGTVTVNADHTLTYLPGLDYFGTSGFITYQLSDGGATSTGTVTLNVTPVNDPPLTAPDAVTILEDQTASLFPLANDTDDSSGAMSLQWVFGFINGASGSANTVTGEATFNPTPDFHGLASFSYRVQDSTGLTSTGVVTVTVLPVNDPPAAVADAATLAEDSSVTVAVLANDSDVDGDPLAIAAVGTAAHGTVSFGAGGVTYTPAADYSGPDSVSYTASDGNGGTATATVTFTVTAVNDPPTAVADVHTVAEDGSGTYAVLANDSDPEGQALTVTAAGGAAHGAVAFGASSVTYTPAADYNGPDAFTYTVADALGATATATVTITVDPVNDAPVAQADSAVTDEEAAITVAVLANDSDADGDSLTVTAVTAGSHGTASFAAGSVTYTPAADYSGSDTVQYTVSDGNGGTAQGSLTITVDPVNDPPVAAADAYSLAEDGSGAFPVLSNDSDPEGQTLTVTAAGGAAHGAVAFGASSVTYTPAASFNGSDSFSYTISDELGATASATVTVTVTAVNDAPTAIGDAAVVSEDGSTVVAVLGNDSDLDGDSFGVTGVSAAAHGTVGFTAASVTYTPAADYHGPDAFTYTITDSQGASASATVSIVVTPVNDAPVAANDSAVTDAGSSVVVAVLQNDSDLEGDPLSVSAVGAPQNGSAAPSAGGTVTYTPDAGYSGADSFTYTVSDGGGATATATVSVIVNNALGQVSVLGLRSVQVETGADVLSGSVVVNAAEPPPYLGATELVLGTGTTVAAGWDVLANVVTISSGATIAADITSNGLTNSGTLLGAAFSPLALPVFAALPALQTSTPGTSDVTVGTNGSITLAPGVYRDLLVAKKGVVTFTGGVYVFRSVVIQREASLLFSAPGTVKVQQRMSTATLTKIQPATVSTATAATIVFHIAGINGTNGALASTPKAVEIATENTLKANFYAANGTLWIQARTTAHGAFLGRHVRIGPDVQVSLNSAW